MAATHGNIHHYSPHAPPLLWANSLSCPRELATGTDVHTICMHEAFDKPKDVSSMHHLAESDLLCTLMPHSHMLQYTPLRVFISSSLILYKSMHNNIQSKFFKFYLQYSEIHIIVYWKLKWYLNLGLYFYVPAGCVAALQRGSQPTGCAAAIQRGWHNVTYTF